MDKVVLEVGVILFVIGLVGWFGAAYRQAYDEAWVQANCSYPASVDCTVYWNEIPVMGALSTAMFLVWISSLIVIVGGVVITKKTPEETAQAEMEAYDDDEESPPSQPPLQP